MRQCRLLKCETAPEGAVHQSAESKWRPFGRARALGVASNRYMPVRDQHAPGIMQRQGQQHGPNQGRVSPRLTTGASQRRRGQGTVEAIWLSQPCRNQSIAMAGNPAFLRRNGVRPRQNDGQGAWISLASRGGLYPGKDFSPGLGELIPRPDDNDSSGRGRPRLRPRATWREAKGFGETRPAHEGPGDRFRSPGSGINHHIAASDQLDLSQHSADGFRRSHVANPTGKLKIPDRQKLGLRLDRGQEPGQLLGAARGRGAGGRQAPAGGQQLEIERCLQRSGLELYAAGVQHA